MRDVLIGFGFSAALFALAIATGEPVQGAELIPSTLQEQSRELIGDLITDRTGNLCALPSVFDHGADWVVICQNSPTVWTMASDGNLYENGNLADAFERNFR